MAGDFNQDEMRENILKEIDSESSKILGEEHGNVQQNRKK